jgi:hypothetical protein
MRRLTMFLSAFKETQAESWSVLPKANHWREAPPYSRCSCIEDILSSFGDQEPQFHFVSPVTILRCGLVDLTKGANNDQKPTTEEVFRYLEEKIPWLLSPDGLKYEVRVKLVILRPKPPFSCLASNVFGKCFLCVLSLEPILPFLRLQRTQSPSPLPVGAIPHLCLPIHLPWLNH